MTPTPQFQGHDNRWINNVVAFVYQFCLHNGYGGHLDPVLPGHEQYLQNNTCVITHDGDYALPICTGGGKSIMGNNRVFSPGGNITECGMPLSAWQAAGNDQGTTAAAYPPTLPQDLIALGRERLFVAARAYY